MKKLIAALLLLLFLPLCAMAQEEIVPVELEITFDGIAVAFEEFGFSLLVPDGWMELNLTGMEEAANVTLLNETLSPLLFEVYMTEAADRTVSVIVVALDAQAYMDGKTLFADSYIENSAWAVINGTRMFVIHDTAQDIGGALIPNGDTLIIIVGEPVSDNDFSTLLEQVVASVTLAQ